MKKGWESGTSARRMGSASAGLVRYQRKLFENMGMHTMVYDNKDIEIVNEPRIAVVGVGGAGCNVVSEIFGSLSSVDTIAINTDKVALHEHTQADKKIYICKEVLKGEGARGDAQMGKKCADIHREEIRNALSGHNFVFVVAGLGGGTGTGAASVVIEAAQAQGILTFAIGINPFFFEGQRLEVAKIGMAHIRNVCEHAYLVHNDKMLSILPDLTMDKAFKEVNRSIAQFIEEEVQVVNFAYNDESVKVKTVRTKDMPEKAIPLSAFMSA